MAKCSQCGTTILFGGTQVGDRLYCRPACRDKDVLRIALNEIPAGFIEERARMVHQGPCPECGGRGPVEAHMTYTIWTLGHVSSHKEKPVIGCHSCGTRARLMAILSCGLFGWWGLHGLIVTPFQIFRNLRGLFAAPDISEPSPTLVAKVRDQLAAQLIEEDKQAKNEVSER